MRELNCLHLDYFNNICKYDLYIPNKIACINFRYLKAPFTNYVYDFVGPRDYTNGIYGLQITSNICLSFLHLKIIFMGLFFLIFLIHLLKPGCGLEAAGSNTMFINYARYSL